ncbi:MAG: tetratricopeptide repeat protein, partial [Anaerolinea sp.]|nr:tetratricopeptide repeat protein [Anaerolinea sp.]
MSGNHLQEFLSKLEAAQSDEEREWLVMQFSLDSLSPALRAAVWAAAVPHWFDQPYLNAILGDEAALSEADFQTLCGLSFVEPFPERGYNVHERTRELLLARLWDDAPDRYRELSGRATAYCAGQEQEDTGWRVETLYHQLLADEPGAVDAFAGQGIDWYNRFEYDKVEALIRPALAAVTANRLVSDAAAWAYYRQGRLDITYSRNREAKVHLQRALDYQKADRGLEANCIQALGDVHLRLSEYELARARYEEARPIYAAIGA